MTNDGQTTGNNFGTFLGVFLPSLLTILGVIMYLRMGWIVGQVGLVGTLIIVTMSTFITLITGLSISTTATNMRVGTGGAYYMISRSLGLEAGAAIGIPLYLAKVMGVAFYLAGFSESVSLLFPSLDPTFVAVVALIAIGVISYLSADLALKTQFFIFAIIVFSLISFFASDVTLLENAEKVAESEFVGFWVVFAIFFPAVTGIEAGLGMSGDLKNPAKSLPIGTIGAIAVGYIVYIAIPIALATRASEAELIQNTMVMKDLSWFQPALVAGIWGATLSSALGALLGAPRTLQALAKDDILPRFLGKGYGKEDEPRLATGISIGIALVAILLGDLDAIAPVLTMFFLTSYGLLNFSAGLEGMIANPSWRPKFRAYPLLSIIGGFLCLAVMFLIDSGATIISLFLTALVYMYISRRGMTAHWGDMRRGILLTLARYSIKKLDLLQENSKSWRPNLLVLTGSPTKRWHLVEFANAVSHGKGFVTLAAVMDQASTGPSRIASLKGTIEEYLKKREINALVRVTVGENLISGSASLVRDYGIGSIVPNTVVLGHRSKLDDIVPFADLLTQIYMLKKNIVIVKSAEMESFMLSGGRVDVWWGRERNNAALSLALGYMMQSDPKLARLELNLKTFAASGEEKRKAEEILEEYRVQSRLDCAVKVYEKSSDDAHVFDGISRESSGASMVFIGLKPPDIELFASDPKQAIEEYASYYRELITRTEGFPPTAIILAAEKVDFTSIFTS